MVCGSITVRLNSSPRGSSLLLSMYSVGCFPSCVAREEWDKNMLITVADRLETSYALG